MASRTKKIATTTPKSGHIFHVHFFCELTLSLARYVFYTLFSFFLVELENWLVRKAGEKH